MKKLMIKELKSDLEVLVDRLELVEKINDLLESSKDLGVEMFDINMMLHEYLSDETHELLEKVSDFDFDINWLYNNVIDELDELIELKKSKEKDDIEYVNYLIARDKLEEGYDYIKHVDNVINEELKGYNIELIDELINKLN